MDTTSPASLAWTPPIVVGMPTRHKPCTGWRNYGPELSGRRGPSVAEVLRRYGPGYLRRFPERVSERQAYVLAQLLQCRQPELGAHAWHCRWCGVSQVAYNGCRNRHCASCGRTRRHDWLRMMRGWTLPVSYLHIIFTLPHELTPLILANDRLLYNLQFEACRRTLIELAERTWGATPGLSMVLHTWGQEALHHPHTHILQTAGGLSRDRRAWISIDPEDDAYEGKQLAHGFRARYLNKLVALYRQGKLTLPASLKWIQSEQDLERWLQPLWRKSWQARSDGPPPHVRNSDAALKYLSRYVMGSALRDSRVIGDDGRDVVIRIKDYRTEQVRPLKLSGEEFVERYLLHVLPERFHRVRHAGLFGSRFRDDYLTLCREALGVACSPAASTQEQRNDGDCLANPRRSDDPFSHSDGSQLKSSNEDDPFELDGEADQEEDEESSSPWKRRCPRCRLPMDPLGLLGASATAYFLEEMQRMWQRVITFLVVTAKVPATDSEMPLFAPRIEWSLLAWTTTTLDASPACIDSIPPPDT